MADTFENPYAQFNLPSKAKANSEKQKTDFNNLGLEWAFDRSPANKTRILGQMRPIMDKHLSQYGDSPILRGQAKLLAINALDTFDASRGDLYTHMNSAMQGLQRHSAKLNQVIDIPERVAIESERLREATNMLEGDLGRPATDIELMDYVGITPERLAYVRQLRRPTNSGKFEDEEGGTYTPSSVKSQNDVLGDVWQQMVYHDLKPTDQTIMEHTLGLNGKKVLSNAQIAAKLRVSPGAVSQRKQKIQQLLDDRYISE